MLRAVKVVRREDFEYERTFEREFQGIQHYEQVSQDHPGLVDVLHVGRDRENGFYYYVMELADDENGAPRNEIDPETYRAKTLSSELRNRPERSVADVVRLGIPLAGALGHLHQAGLTHRDVKPSNIIFVKGVPKLADVGLVARDGQRTYVGTEGYVPPEGPGTSAADLYSLAMVLYELHTNKDRLDFPELPTNLEIPPTVNRDEWRALNGVICRAGSPDPRKRYENAHAFALALRQVLGTDLPTGPSRRGSSSGKKRGGFARFAGTTLLLVLLGAAGAGYWLWKDNKEFFAEYGMLFAGNKGGETPSADTPRENPTIDPVVSEPELSPIPEEADGGTEEGSAENPDAVTATDTTPAGDEADQDGKKSGNGSDAPEQVTDSTDQAPTMPPEDSDTTKPDSPSTLEPTVVTDDRPLVAEAVVGRVEVLSEPSGATVWVDGKEIGRTKTQTLEFPPGTVEFVLRHPDYRDTVHRAEISEGFQLVNVSLLPNLGPIPGNPWFNSLDVRFIPTLSGHHETDGPISSTVFDLFLAETGREIPVVAREGIAHVYDDQHAYEFCDWMTRLDRAGGFLGPDQYHRPLRPAGDAQGDSFYCRVENRFGALILNSDPEGAVAVVNGEPRGETPVVVDRVRFGPYRIEFHLPGYAVAEIVSTAPLESTEAIALPVQPLQRDASVVFGERWTNTQGMPLVPVGDIMVAAFETRVSDYREFVTAAGGTAMPSAGFSQALNHPVAGISRIEAERFCEWLTRKERATGMIRPWQSYRLPTDVEWSLMAGEQGESGSTPSERSGNGNGRFLWGDSWPPPAGAGNLADLAASPERGQYVINGYNDGHAYTSPSGSFDPAENGLYDLSGNVWEWVSDPFDGDDAFHVARGGGWNSNEPDTLRASYRSSFPAGTRDGGIGFRYVLDDTQ